MAICALVDPGTGAITASPSTPVAACDGFLLLGVEEYPASIFAGLTPESASDLAGAILLVWATAWAFRMLARLISDVSNPEKGES